MGYYVSGMFGIRTGGVFSDDVDTDDILKRVNKVLEETNEPRLKNFDHCMSKELVATKGSYVVIAGVFNYWMPDDQMKFAKRLSEEFGVEVMAMAWDEEREEARCNIFLGGKELFEIDENPIGRILRRIC